MNASDDASKHIRDLVEKHYDSSQNPLLLSTLGAYLARAGIRIPAGMTLRNFVESVLSEQLVTVQHSKVKAFIAVAPRGRYEEVRAAVEARGSPTAALGDDVLTKLSKNILIGFCITIPQDRHVFLSLRRPVRYKVCESAPGENYEEIEQEYRSPGLFVGNPREIEPNDRSKLLAGIKNWCLQHGTSIEELIRLSRQWVPDSDLSKSHTALQRLISVQPEDILPRMVIPADIIKILSGER